jgi:TnpA family transposase
LIPNGKRLSRWQLLSLPFSLRVLPEQSFDEQPHGSLHLLPAGHRIGVESPQQRHPLELAIQGKINEKLILGHWDDIPRLAASLKLSWVTASLLVSRLQAKPRKNALTRTLQEYGRLQKTIIPLRYTQDVDLGKRINRQLNKGEELHALRRFLFFANEGHVRKRQIEEQTDQALCRNLITNAFMAWNTVRYQEILKQLKNEGYPLPATLLPNPSPHSLRT